MGKEYGESVESLIEDLWSLGMELSFEDDELICRGPEGVISAELANRIRAHKLEIINILRSAGSVGRARIAGIKRERGRDFYPASSQQRRLYALQQLDPDSTAYNISAAYLLDKDFDVGRLERVANAVIERHESLRTRFEVVGDDLCQFIAKKVPFGVGIENIAEGEVEEKVMAFVRPFDLGIAPLLRLKVLRKSDGDCIFLTDMHHIISDGTSNDILIRDFAFAFEGKTLRPLQLHYKDYSVWQQEGEGRELFDRQREYWLGCFEGGVPVLEMPMDFTRPKVRDFEGASLKVFWDGPAKSLWGDFSRERGITLYMLLLASFGVVLSRWSGQEDMVVGNVVSGRDHEYLEGIIGMFVNTLAMRVRPETGKSFVDYLEEVKNTCLDGLVNQQYPFEELIEGLNLYRDTSRNPLFDVMLVVQNFDSSSLSEVVEGGIRPYELETAIAKFDLSITANEASDGISLGFNYATSLFRKESIERFASQFKSVIEFVLKDPDCLLERIEILDADEKACLLEKFNDTVSEFSDECSLNRMFARQVELNGDSVALVYQRDECMGGGFETLTYRDIDERSNRLARRLRLEFWAPPESLIGLCLERSVEMVVGILGILKAGAGYLPIDVKYPASWVEFMLKDGEVDILLTTGEFRSGVDFDGCVIDLKDSDSYFESADPLEDVSGPNSLAYCIYTSGSTGRSKGVLVEHSSVVNLVQNPNYVSWSPDDVILPTGSISFDAMTFELWGGLLNGLRLVLVEGKCILDTDVLGKLLHEARVTTMWLTSPLFDRHIENDPSIFATLRQLVVGGDVVHRESVFKAYEANPDLKVINGYGPTETTTFAVCGEISKNPHGVVPIGRPIQNYCIRILDENMRICPVCVVGELYVGGIGVSRGYLNRKDLNALSFIEDPYDSGKRLYRTGDRARWLADGRIEFLGRIDSQVKIRGFRIEMGEIETALLELPEVNSAVAVAVEIRGVQTLVAYVTSEEGGLDLDLLRSELGVRLPNYMLPSYFIELEELPLTSNGKVDRNKLPELKKSSMKSKGYVGPRNEVEEGLIVIWRELLGLESVGIDDDFFSLGGNSILLMKMSSMVKDRLEIPVSVTDLFLYPTIRALSGAYDAKSRANEGQKDEDAGRSRSYRDMRRRRRERSCRG